MQIISGKYKGRKLFLPPGARPTQNRARIALFNMLDNLPITIHCAPLNIWDAFAGSGAFGIEFLSRFTNKSVIFTDINPESIKNIRKNLTGIDGNASVIQTNAVTASDKLGKIADIIFIDPPYANADMGTRLVAKLANIAKSGAVIVWEMESDGNHEIPHNMTVIKDKTYGRARFLILTTNH
ncbi:MAG: RsmD family RNA methyltransferase [Rickettsiales bacterium]|nr:RsmD family RNA methyltransferase [Rickettsiales bacterium]